MRKEVKKCRSQFDGLLSILMALSTLCMRFRFIRISRIFHFSSHQEKKNVNSMPEMIFAKKKKKKGDHRHDEKEIPQREMKIIEFRIKKLRKFI